MPNMMPRIGSGKCAGVFYNTGHGHLGWTLSPITAEMIAEVIVQTGPAQSNSVQGASVVEFKRAS